MTEIEIDKIIDYFLKNTKPVGKPYVWVNEEEKEEIKGILNDDRFKFRWYSYIYQEMCEVNCIEPDNEFINFNQGKYNNISTAIKPENGVLMQSTGLKDKNGKLIYEMDIVKTFIDRDIVVGVVAWCEKVLRYYLNTTDYFGDKYVTDFDIYKSLGYEVIGNIYENKDLLNENS